MARLVRSELFAGFSEQLTSTRQRTWMPPRSDGIVKTDDPNRFLAITILTWWEDVHEGQTFSCVVKNDAGRTWNVQQTVAEGRGVSLNYPDWKGYGSLDIRLLYEGDEVARHPLAVVPQDT
jgi:hypothetical protein